MTYLLLPFSSLRNKDTEGSRERIESRAHRTGSGKRIPDTLKAVFLASNAGKNVDVIKPPPARVASRVFFANVLTSFKHVSMPRSVRRKKFGKARSAEEDVVTECGTECPDLDVDLNFAVFEKLIPTMEPQEYYETMIRSRGYSTICYETVHSGYYNKPTALQLASNDARLIELVRKRDFPALQDLMLCGISLNPCNKHGESLIHTVCRLGDLEMFKLLLNAGASVQVADDHGRTPLHDACWTVKPCFEIVEILLTIDRHMLHMQDARGATPLFYVRRDNWAQWVEFLVAKREVFWPQRGDSKEEAAPAIAIMSPNSRPVADPSNALTPRLAAMVVSGKINLTELEVLRGDVLLDAKGELVVESSECEDEDDSDDDSESSDTDYESDCDYLDELEDESIFKFVSARNDEILCK